MEILFRIALAGLFHRCAVGEALVSVTMYAFVFLLITSLTIKRARSRLFFVFSLVPVALCFLRSSALRRVVSPPRTPPVSEMIAAPAPIRRSSFDSCNSRNSDGVSSFRDWESFEGVMATITDVM